MFGSFACFFFAVDSLLISGVHLQVISATGLRAADFNGLSDPYCKVRLGKHKSQTKVIPETLTPSLNETFTFDADTVEQALLAPSATVRFEVFDSDQLSLDDFLGQVNWFVSSTYLCSVA